jgi:hypothetical protein
MTILEIITWIKGYRFNTHAIASLVAFLPVFYTQNAQFHDAVTALWLHVPNGLRGLIVAAGPLWMLYRNSLKGVTIPGNTVQAMAAQQASRQASGRAPLSGFGEK